MKILLSSNPYRDRGLRAALEARRVLENAGAQTSLCLPFQPKSASAPSKNSNPNSKAVA